MIDKTSPRAIKFYSKRPVVEVYKGYEIRKFNNMFEVIASVGIYGHSSNNINSCYTFIDNLVNLGIKQDDDEEVAKYIFHIKPYNK